MHPHLILAAHQKPLIKIFNGLGYSQILQLKEKTLMYWYEIIHTPVQPGIMQIADVTSRNPVKSEDNDQSTICIMATMSYVRHQADGINTVDWQSIKHHASYNQQCVSLARYIEAGFPTSKEDLLPKLRTFWTMYNDKDLYVISNVPFKEKEMLIPKKSEQSYWWGYTRPMKA